MKINIAVTALSLIGTRAVEVPDWKVFWCHWFHVESFRLAAKIFPSSVHPHVHGLNTFSLVECHIFFGRGFAVIHDV